MNDNCFWSVSKHELKLQFKLQDVFGSVFEVVVTLIS